ncbi:MAG: putative Ig domain-containing protein, partial [Candidatus Omnitrophota bacterium]
TVNENVKLEFTVSATDADGGALTYTASNLPSGASFNQTTKAFSWTPGSGTANTYTGIVFLVSDGELSDSETITITVNKEVALTPVTTTNYVGAWSNENVSIILTATDNLSGIKNTYYKINNGQTFVVNVSGQPVITTEGANNSLEFWSVNNANIEELPHKTLSNIKLDKTAPVITNVVPQNAVTVSQNTITVSGIVNDLVSGVDMLEVTVGPQVYRPSIGIDGSFSVSGVNIVNGANAAIIKAKDKAGNSAEIHRIVTFIDPRPPTPVVTAQALYSPLGFRVSWLALSDIVEYQYQITQESRHPGYDVVGTAIYRDWTSISPSAISITVTDLSLHCLGPFKISLKAKNSTGLWSEVGFSDEFYFDSRAKMPPTVDSVSPEDYSTVLAGAMVAIKVNAASCDSSPLKYQFYIGGQLKQDWSLLNTYNWQTSSSDTGYVDIICYVKCDNSLVGGQRMVYYIVNPTAKDVLQKVADNYANIYDIKADVVMASTLAGKAYGQEEYLRYYFKAPSKEKLEAKSEVTIIDNEKMYFIDPINKNKQQVVALSSADLKALQSIQAEICYNQNLFLSQHKIARNSLDSDLNKGLVSLVAVPNIVNKIYDRLGILADYSKGIISKFSIYRKNVLGGLELLKEVEVIKPGQTLNGAWLPVRTTEAIMTNAGKMIYTSEYNNLQVNTGLADLEFDPDK